MIILDTNVLGELARERPDHRVVVWLDRQITNDLVTTAISVAEMTYGVERLPLGKRRSDLARINATILSGLAAILPFSADDAIAYGEIVANAMSRGRDIKPFDAQIAAIAKINAAVLATRNTKDFTACGIDLIDPWTA
jgi:predicted nucleic acid-binding protein